MFTLLRNRLSVAVVVILVTVVTVLVLAVTLYASRSPGDPPPAAQSSGAANLISSGSSADTQDPRFCIVPLEGIERLTGKESTPRPDSDPQSAALSHQVSFVSGDAPQGTPIPTSTPVPGQGVTFCNPTHVTIPNVGPSTPYPSDIVVQGLTGTITNVSVDLKHFFHEQMADVDMLLVGPQGQSVVLLSDAGDACAPNWDATLVDGATPFPAVHCPPTPHVNAPANYGEGADPFPSPAPGPPYGDSLAVFNGTDPNGTWHLYTVDDYPLLHGDLNNGWCLTLTTNGAVTPSPSPTAPAPTTESPTVLPDTVTPSPTTCPISAYTISTGTGVIVPGVSDSSVHCDDCTRFITLPFPYTLYNHTFTTASLGSNGTVGFGTNSNWSTNSCLPTSINPYEYVIFPFWDDQTTLPSGKGIYTSVSGLAPDRIFNIEFRNCGFSVSGCAPGTDSNYEVRLYENQTRFDVVYGTMGLNGSGATIGVQWNGGWATQYSCNTASVTSGMMLTFTYPPCGTLTPTPTTTPAVSTHTPTAAATVTAAASSQTPTAPAATPTTCTIEFTDVPPGSTFYTYIHCLACMNIVNGYPDGTFRPNNNITRGQLTKIVCNSANCPIQSLPQAFEDIPPGSTFYDQVNTLAYLGYINGYPCGSGGEPCVPPENRPYFRPINSATRGQISKIISNIAGFNEPIIGQTFEDVPPGSTFYDFIERLVLHNVINGYPCGSPGEPCVPPENRPYFRPSRHASRGQTSKIVANTFFPNCNPTR